MTYKPPPWSAKDVNDMVKRWSRGRIHPAEMPLFQRTIARRREQKPPAPTDDSD